MKKRNLTIKDAGVAFVASFAISQLTSFIGLIIIQSVLLSFGISEARLDSFFNSALGYLVQAICMDIGFVLVFIWYYKRMHKSEVFNKPDKKSYKYLAICIAIGVASLFLLSGSLNYFQLLIDKLGFKSATLSYKLNSPGKYLISLISLAVIPAICEELIFRGVIVNGLKSKGTTFAIILSSIMFSMFHFSASQLIYPFCFGLILSIVYLRTQNIIFPIILHFTNNALSLSIQYFGNSSGVFTHSVSMLKYAIFTLAIWITLIVWLFKNFKQYQANKAKSNEYNQQHATESETSHAEQQHNQKVLFWCIAIMFCLYMLLI